MNVASPGMDVDQRGFRLPAGCESAVDVLFDGRRIWSFSPDLAVPSGSGGPWVAWPPALLPFLDGTATVVLRNHVSGVEIAREDVRFGAGEGRVQVVDRAGRPVVVDKWGKLNRPFDATDRDVVEGYLDEVEGVLRFLRDECGVPAFLSFGSLLGAVREGKMIGHDVDIDIGYYSSCEHPADLVLESFRIERRLRANGWRVLRQNGGFLALFLPQPDGSERNMDIFAAFTVGGHFYQVHDIRVPGDESLVLPLGSVSFEGRQFPAPAKPEALLEGAYGPGWRVPDPAFKFRPGRALARRIEGWLGGFKNHRPYWDPFYRNRGREVPTEPSSFAEWAEAFIAEVPDALVLDLGCGNGRDSVHFAEQGSRVVGADFSGAALRVANRLARRRGAEVEFRAWNLNSTRDTLTQAALLARDPSPKVVYARFLVDALNDAARQNFWLATHMLSRAGGRAILEFRTPRARKGPKHFGRHFRRFLDPDFVEAEARRRGAEVVARLQGRGLAPLGEEDPEVCRLVLQWPGG